jgi:hypothetical protein
MHFITCKTTNAIIYIHIKLSTYYTISATTCSPHHMQKLQMQLCLLLLYVCPSTFTSTSCVLITSTTTVCVLITALLLVMCPHYLNTNVSSLPLRKYPPHHLKNLIHHYTSEVWQVTYVSILRYNCYCMLTSSHAKPLMILHLLGTSHMYICVYTHAGRHLDGFEFTEEPSSNADVC